MNSQYSLAIKIKKRPTNDARREQNRNNNSRKSATKLKGLYLQQQQILQLSTQRAKEEICFVVSAEQQRQLEIIIAITAASSCEPFQALRSYVAFIQYLCSGVFSLSSLNRQFTNRILNADLSHARNPVFTGVKHLLWSLVGSVITWAWDPFSMR